MSEMSAPLVLREGDSEFAILLGHIRLYGTACISEHLGNDPEGYADHWFRWLELRLKQQWLPKVDAEREVLHRASVAVGWGEGVEPWRSVAEFAMYEEERKKLDAEYLAFGASPRGTGA